jgi:hypothetical protein
MESTGFIGADVMAHPGAVLYYPALRSSPALSSPASPSRRREPTIALAVAVPVSPGAGAPG